MDARKQHSKHLPTACWDNTDAKDLARDLQVYTLTIDSKQLRYSHPTVQLMWMADKVIVVQNSSKFFGTPYSEVYHLSTYIKSKLIGSSF